MKVHKVEHRFMAIRGIVKVYEQEGSQVSIVVTADDGRKMIFYDLREFQKYWIPKGRVKVIEDDDPLPKVEYDDDEEARIEERERLDEEEYLEKVADYVIRSQDCMEKNGCWVPPSTKFRNRKPRTI